MATGNPIDPKGGILSTSHKTKPDDRMLFATPLLLQDFYPSNMGPPREPGRLLHMTARLGMPLYFYPCPDLPTKIQHGLDNDSSTQRISTIPENLALKNFSMQQGPDKEAVQYTEKQHGNFLLKRADGKELKMLHALVMWSFIEHTLNYAIWHDQFSNRPGAKPLEVSVVDEFHATMTPENLVKFWNNQCDKDGMVEDWDFPVNLGCKACGKEGSKLSGCKGCGVVKYCDKKCQKDDWKAHKSVCIKA